MSLCNLFQVAMNGRDRANSIAEVLETADGFALTPLYVESHKAGDHLQVVLHAVMYLEQKKPLVFEGGLKLGSASLDRRLHPSPCGSRRSQCENAREQKCKPRRSCQGHYCSCHQHS